MRQREAVSVFCAAGAVAYDYELDEDGQRVAHEDPGVPLCLRRVLGDDFLRWRK